MGFNRSKLPTHARKISRSLCHLGKIQLCSGAQGTFRSPTSTSLMELGCAHGMMQVGRPSVINLAITLPSSNSTHLADWIWHRGALGCVIRRPWISPRKWAGPISTSSSSAKYSAQTLLLQKATSKPHDGNARASTSCKVMCQRRHACSNACGIPAVRPLPLLPLLAGSGLPAPALGTKRPRSFSPASVAKPRTALWTSFRASAARMVGHGKCVRRM
mmetsp:Transcript_116615/g.291185  ORF Transcript_116615/g.291185 Transcript_116615/m.291185 type:complete len:217 (-) Transcript_116615:273-923(-)